MKNLRWLSVFMICLAMASAWAQDAQDTLFKELAERDRLLFKAGRDCDLAAFDQLIAEDIEFFHDQAATTRGRETFKKSIETLCANYGGLRRELVAGSLEVYPMHDGAVQMGEHRFFIKNEAGEITPTVTARFIHLWVKRDGQWQVYRVISYDHQPIEGAD